MKTTRILAAAILATTAATSANAALLLEYKFNETGTTATPGGTTAGTAPVLTLENSAGTATDLHTADAGGVSGLAGDRAFDNSASTAMGNAGSGGRAIHAADFNAIDALASYTWQGWFNVSTQIGNAARLMESRSTSAGWLLFAGTTGALSLQMDGASSVSSSASYTGTDEWVFFAVTYDGTLTADNLKFYQGTKTSAVAQVGTTLTLNEGVVNSDSGALVIGNSTSAGTGFTRPLDGLLDNMRIYGAADNTGVLSLSELEAVRVADIVPEPASALLALCGGAALLLRRRR